jgi:hypothetical protein
MDAFGFARQHDTIVACQSEPHERRSFTTPRSVGSMLLFLAGMIFRSAGWGLGNVLIASILPEVIDAIVKALPRR